MPTRGKPGQAERFAHIPNLFASFGPVSIRRMFGGAGIYADGLMFGLVVGDAIYLKTDPQDTEAFTREGCAPFSFATAKGTQTITSYWRMPDRLYDDDEELARWAHAALAAARAAQARKKGGAKRARKAGASAF